MSETKTPFLVDPEVTKEAEKISEAIDAERLAYDYLTTQERIFSILDELGEYFTYEDLLNSDFVKDFQADPKLQEAIAQFMAKNKEISLIKEEITGSIDRDLDHDYNRLNGARNRGEISTEKMNEELTNKYSEETVTELYRKISELKGVGSTLSDEEIAESLKHLGFEDDKAIQLHLLIQNLKKHSEDAKMTEREGSTQKHPILLGDYLKILEIGGENPSEGAGILDRLIIKPLFRNIVDRFNKEETERLSRSLSDERAYSERKDARILGTYFKLLDLQSAQLKTCLEKLSSLGDDPEAMSQIRTFRVSVMPEVRAQIKELRDKKRSLRVAQLSKNISMLRSAEEIAEMTGGNAERIQSWRDAGQRVAEEYFGYSITAGMGETIIETGNTVNREFLAAYINYKSELKYLTRMLNEGKIVETQHIKDIINRALPYLTKNPPTIVYFNGDYGTGKTAIAVHLCRTHLGKEPIIVSGSKFIEPDRLTEELMIKRPDTIDLLNDMRVKSGEQATLSADTPPPTIASEFASARIEIRELIVRNRLITKFMTEKQIDPVSTNIDDLAASEDFRKFFEENKDTLSDQDNGDIDKAVDTMYSNEVEGIYVLGAMYRAMKEGRPLIIDEANAIPQEVLIAFNDLLTRKIGEPIPTRTNEGEVRVNPGYCIIWTGNTGRGGRYAKGREGMDPATFSRVAPIWVDYLPQSVTSQNMESLIKRLDLSKISDETYDETDGDVERFVKETRIQADCDQIFQVMLIKLLNKRYGAEVLCKKNSSGEVDRYSFIKDLYRVSVGARMIMNLFEGKAEGVPNLPNLERLIGSANPTDMTEKLKNSNLSIRELIDNIVGGYLDEGCSMDLEYYLYKFVQKQSQYSEEQAIIYAILQNAGMFKKSEGWVDYQEIARDKNLSSAEERLSKLKSEIEKNPVDFVDKYEKLQENGNYVSMLKPKKGQKSDYVLGYLSSLEIVQLIYGYLPPRKKAEYDKYYEASSRLKEANMTESEQDLQTRERIKKIADSIQENILLVRSNPGWQGSSSEEKIELSSRLKSFGIHDDEVRNKMGLEAFFQSADKFVETIVSYLVEKREITEKEAQEIRSQETTEGKLEMLKQFQSRKNIKNSKTKE